MMILVPRLAAAAAMLALAGVASLKKHNEEQNQINQK